MEEHVWVSMILFYQCIDLKLQIFEACFQSHAGR